MNSHSRRLSSTAPVPERPATNSSKSGTQNVFWTSTTSTASRNESSVEGGRSCSSAQAGASRARSSYGTRQTSPTRFGSKCAGSGSSRMVTCQSRRGARPASCIDVSFPPAARSVVRGRPGAGAGRRHGGDRARLPGAPRDQLSPVRGAGGAGRGVRRDCRCLRGDRRELDRLGPPRRRGGGGPAPAAGGAAPPPPPPPPRPPPPPAAPPPPPPRPPPARPAPGGGGRPPP